MQIDNYQVTIKIDDRGEFGRYGKVFAKNLYECDDKDTVGSVYTDLYSCCYQQPDSSGIR